MTTLLVTEAIDVVRRNLDELGLNDSVMYGDENEDNQSLDNIIAKTLPDAINAVYASAPAAMLEGKELRKEYVDNNVKKSDYTSLVIRDKVIHFTFPFKVLRMVSMRAFDTDFVVTDIIPEASAEGRMQNNPYIRGTYDNPRLVREQGQISASSFRYYTLKENNEDFSLSEWLNRLPSSTEAFPIAQLIYVPYAEIGNSSYGVSTELRDHILNRLTGMVLAIYGEMEKAGYFLNLATINNQ